MKARKSIILSILLGILIHFTVQAQGAAPIISDIGNQTTNEDIATSAINFTVVDTDTPIESLIVTGSSSDQSLVPNANIVFGSETGTSRTVTITPSNNQNGTATITITVTDGETPVSDSFDLTVDPVNDAPSCFDTSLSTDEDIDGNADPSCNDIDSGTLIYSIVEQAGHGMAGTSTTKLLYDPSPNFSGDDTFTYKANDGSEDSNAATVTVTVTALNDAPVCQTVAITTDEESTGSTAPDCSDADDDEMSFAVVSGPSHGLAEVVAGQLEYIPELNHAGSDQFTYKANDGDLDSQPADVNVTINNLNDRPVAEGQSVSTAEDTAKAITLVATDVDGDSLDYSIVEPPDHGDLSGTPPNVSYLPDTNFSGADSFSFKANDSALDSNTATVSITINAVNDEPTGLNLSGNTIEEKQDPGVVIGSFSSVDVDTAQQDFSYALVTGVNCNGAADNASFEIVGNQLRSKAVFDFETKNTYRICVQTDDGDNTLREPFQINVLDQPTSITVEPMDNLTSETGDEGSFTVVLDFRPSANVAISLSSSDPGEGVVLAPATLTFTPSTWNTPQTVRVKGINDSSADGSQPYTIETAPAVSADGDYDGLDPVDVSMTNADDDTAGISVAPLTGLVTTEGRISRKIQVKLNTQPTAGVTFTFTSSDLSEGTVSPGQLTIAPANWNITYEVEVTGVNDRNVDGDKPYSITVVTDSADLNYNNRRQTVSAVNRDAPNIDWTSPVETEQIYVIFDLSPFLLRAGRTSPEEIAKVVFYRWSETLQDQIDIAEITNPPYEYWFDPGLQNNKLEDDFNQFFARAIDSQGDFIDVRMLVDKRGNVRQVFVPISRRAP